VHPALGNLWRHPFGLFKVLDSIPRQPLQDSHAAATTVGATASRVPDLAARVRTGGSAPKFNGGRYNVPMFFRRHRPTELTFQDRLNSLMRAGFSVAPRPDGTVLVSKGECAVALRETGGQVRRAELAGILMGGEIGSLVDGGYQKFFRTPSGKSKPALADDLNALHDFEEDLKQGLGLETLYNEALGTVSTYYLYDRVKDRDHGVPKRVWEQ